MKKKVLEFSVFSNTMEKIESGELTEIYVQLNKEWAVRLSLVKSKEFFCFSTLCKELKNGKTKSDFTHIRFLQYLIGPSGILKSGVAYFVEKEIESITIGKRKKVFCPDKGLDTEFFIIKFK